MVGRARSDVWLVGLAVVTAVGAWVGQAQPAVGPVVAAGIGSAAVLVIGGVVLGRGRSASWWLVGAALWALATLAAGVMAQRAVAGLTPPGRGRIVADVTLVADPTRLPRGGVRAEARYQGKRVAVVAYRSAAAALDHRMAGERIEVIGDLSPPGLYEQRMRHRHLAGRLAVQTVTGWAPGNGLSTATNRLRRVLARGAMALPERQRGLFLGIVIGDDRDQPPDMVAAFRTSGLAHLTAVSGENVAFVLAAAAPVLRRLRLAPRLLATLALLGEFAMLTRAEPSVLRATGMAAVAAYGAAVGRPTTGLRALAATVTVLLLCDPLLVTSLGFQLSVAGAGGIVTAAAPIRRRLPGPDWLVTPVAVMLAAQLAVAPLLVAAFGSVALVSLPANLVAAPAVGPAMAWGLVGGLLAGVLGGRPAVVLQLPTRLLVAWIEGVARTAARWPLAHIAARDLGMIVTVVIALALVRRLLAGPRNPPDEDVREFLVPSTP